MKDYLMSLVESEKDSAKKLNVMREYLQSYILRILFDMNAFHHMAFVGGTALRFIHGLPRFSEDLDFSLEDKSSAYQFLEILKKIKSELELAGYRFSVAYNDKKTVNHAFIKFRDLLLEAELAPMADQSLSIKIEIDSKPPKGAKTENVIVNKYFPMNFLTYDINSLFAGKMHALISRRYTKGRDLFDLGWYLSKWKDISPNFVLLKNSLEQTGHKGKIPGENDWKDFLLNTVSKCDWKKVNSDVGQFLEDSVDLKIFTKENIISLLK